VSLRTGAPFCNAGSQDPQGAQVRWEGVYVQAGPVIAPAQHLNDKFCRWPSGLAGACSMGDMRIIPDGPRRRLLPIGIRGDDGSAGPETGHNATEIVNKQPNLKVTWPDVGFGGFDTTHEI
jgi:hypothetical protein